VEPRRQDDRLRLVYSQVPPALRHPGQGRRAAPAHPPRGRRLLPRLEALRASRRAAKAQRRTREAEGRRGGRGLAPLPFALLLCFSSCSAPLRLCVRLLFGGGRPVTGACTPASPTR